MLRLTLTGDGTTQPQMKAEGRLVGDWAGLLETECSRLLSQSQRIELDMGGVTDVDARGLEALRRLRKQSVTLTACTPLMLALMAEEEVL
jgi:hypothetical protein